MHVPFFVGPALLAISGWEGPPRHPAVVIPVAVTMGALQLRHSLAAVRGERLRGATISFALLLLLVAVPTLWFTRIWWSTAHLVVASAAMLFRGWPARVLVGVSLVGTSAGIGTYDWIVYNPWSGVVTFASWCGLTAAMAGSLYAAAHLVRAVDEIHALRLDLADQAVGRERLRVSRDLHDLLGQSLTAISLKGDLALAMLPSDSAGAATEIRSLTAVVRDVSRDTRQVTRGEHIVSLCTEVERAARLFEAAGIDARIDVALSGLVPAVDEVLAWATREGVTNLLRHSHARRCSITATRHGGMVRLEIVNDCAKPAGDDTTGQGLAGVAERSRALSGSASAERLANGRFVLRVDLPDAAALSQRAPMTPVIANSGHQFLPT